MKSCGHRLRFSKSLFLVLIFSSALFLLKSALKFRNQAIGKKQLSKRRFGWGRLMPLSAIVYQEKLKRSKSSLLAAVEYLETGENSVIFLPEEFSDDYTRQMVRGDFYNCIAQSSEDYNDKRQKNKIHKLFEFTLPSSLERDWNSSVTDFKRIDTLIRQLHPIHAAFVVFSRLCKTLSIKAMLIEPSILFCMLTQANQSLLQKRGFNINSLKGGENVLTFAINEGDSIKLSGPSVVQELFPMEFSFWSIEKGKPHFQNVSLNLDVHTHHFFVHHQVVIHVVVFHQRNHYLWHGSIEKLPNEVLNFTRMENLLFSKTEAIYERFVPVEIPAGPLLEAIYIPSDPRFFLHEISTSQFLYCNLSNAVHINLTSSKSPESTSQTKFKRRAITALQEMKLQLRPELMTFWIMGGTLLGWYRECGIIPYTTDVDFTAWAADIDDTRKLAKRFIKNKHLTLKEVMGLPDEALEYKFLSYGLKVDLFFCYDDGKQYWVSGHRPAKGYYFPYNYPRFTLCSADLLGHKVHVPCDTLKVLLSDYGTDWVKPIKKWNYEVSPKNMGKKRYWYEEEKPYIYITYS